MENPPHLLHFLFILLHFKQYLRFSSVNTLSLYRLTNEGKTKFTERESKSRETGVVKGVARFAREPLGGTLQSQNKP